MAEAGLIKEEVAWNLSQAIIDQIGLLISSFVKNYKVYDYEKAFRDMKSIRLIIVANLNTNERTDTKSKEKSLDFLLSQRSFASNKDGFDNTKQIEFSKKNGKDLIKNLDDYVELLMDLLKKYGYLIPVKEDKKNLNR